MKKKIRKFENHSITRRLYLLFSLICLLFLVLIARLGYMQITHQAYYTDKLAKATNIFRQDPKARLTDNYIFL